LAREAFQKSSRPRGRQDRRDRAQRYEGDQPQRLGASRTPPAPAKPQTTAATAAAQDNQSASKSDDWAIQFAAAKSEAEAQAAAARLNAKYGPALNGATIGVHKTQVNDGTIYALRVGGLSKAGATALCVRVKGRDCSIAN
jgi:hypothetical protein